MFDRNAVMIDRSPQTADPRLEKTKNSRSPHTQQCDIQETNDDILQTHKIFHFQNYGTVYMDSFNAHGVRMENCGNNVPQINCSLNFPLTPAFSSNLAISYYLDHFPRIIGNGRVLHSQPHAVSNGMWAFAPSAITCWICIYFLL